MFERQRWRFCILWRLSDYKSWVWAGAGSSLGCPRGPEHSAALRGFPKRLSRELDSEGCSQGMAVVQVAEKPTPVLSLTSCL